LRGEREERGTTSSSSGSTVSRHPGCQLVAKVARVEGVPSSSSSRSSTGNRGGCCPGSWWLRWPEVPSREEAGGDYWHRVTSPAAANGSRWRGCVGGKAG